MLSVNFSYVCIIYVKIYEKISSGVLEVSLSIYTMHSKFSNCFVWVSPSTLNLEFHLLS